MKIIFLDIDGVLNSLRSSRAFGGYPHDFGPEDMTRFDMVAVALVRRLCTELGAKVVLSSTWRLHFSVEEAADALDLPIIDRTPEDPAGYDGRGHEIKAWLEAHQEVEHYAILDDQAVMLPEQQPHFVQTDEAMGMTLADFAAVRFRLLDPDMAI